MTDTKTPEDLAACFTEDTKTTTKTVADETITDGPITDEATTDSATTGSSEKTESDLLKEEITALQAEITTLKDQVLRTVADRDNTRRRLEKEKKDAQKFAITKFAQDVLVLGDNLKRATDTLDPEAHGTVIEGLGVVQSEFDSIVVRHGMVAVEPALGDKLDPHLHQAMVQMPSDQPEGTIAQVMQTGYVLNDRLIRPALVGVATPLPKTEEAAE
jgi:molecular chaperone GrpE